MRPDKTPVAGMTAGSTSGGDGAVPWEPVGLCYPNRDGVGYYRVCITWARRAAS